MAVHDPLTVTLCWRDVPLVPHPAQPHVPPVFGCGPNVIDEPELTVTLLVCCQAPPLTSRYGMIAVGVQVGVGVGVGVGAGVGVPGTVTLKLLVLLAPQLLV